MGEKRNLYKPECLTNNQEWYVAFIKENINTFRWLSISLCLNFLIIVS